MLLPEGEGVTRHHPDSRLEGVGPGLLVDDKDNLEAWVESGSNTRRSRCQVIHVRIKVLLIYIPATDTPLREGAEGFAVCIPGLKGTGSEAAVNRHRDNNTPILGIIDIIYPRAITVATWTYLTHPVRNREPANPIPARNNQFKNDD